MRRVRPVTWCSGTFPKLMNVAALLTGSMLLGCPSGSPSKREARADTRHGRGDAGVDSGVTLLDPASGTPVILAEDKLPDTFPKTVPLYPGAKVIGTVLTVEGGKRTHVATFTTPDVPASVDDFYRTHAKGFAPQGEHASAEALDRTLTIVDAAVPLRLRITTSRSGPGSTIQITTVEG